MIVLCFGDSDTVGFYDTQGGWVERLRRRLHHERPTEYIAVYNLGISGNRAVDVLERFDNETTVRRAMDPEEVLTIIIAIGTNDAAFLHGRNATWSSTDEYADALRAILEKAHQCTPQVILCGLTPGDEQRSDPVPWQTRDGETISYRNTDISAFDAVAKTIAQETNTSFVDMQQTFRAHGNVPKLLSDGVHPNDEGHQLFAEAVRARMNV